MGAQTKAGFEGGKIEKEEAHGRVQDDEHLFLTNQEPKREINSF